MPSIEWRCAIMKPAGTESPLSLWPCQVFLCYLAGVPTTALSARYAVPAARINRGIKRTARLLLAAAGSEYEKNRPIVHLSRLRNESSLWIFRLAVAAPSDVALTLCCAKTGFGATGDAVEYTQAYGRLRALFLEHLQRWGAPSCRHDRKSDGGHVAPGQAGDWGQTMGDRRI